MSSFVDWLQNDTAGLLTLAAVSIAFLLLLIIKFKLEPFIALIVVGLLVALAAGLGVNELVGTPTTAAESLLETGFGGILGHIAPIIGLGTVLGSVAGGALAAASTFALGKAFCFYNRAVLEGHVPDAEDLRRYYKEQMGLAEQAWKRLRPEPAQKEEAKR